MFGNYLKIAFRNQKRQKEFFKWILIANIISQPIGYYMMNKWLQNFAYRIDLTILLFLLVGTAVLVIALLTVSCYRQYARRWRIR